MKMAGMIINIFQRNTNRTRNIQPGNRNLSNMTAILKHKTI